MKNYLLLAVIIGSCCLSCKQGKRQSFTLTGEIKGLSDRYIYLQMTDGDSSKTDSAVVTNGHFVFNGSTAELSMSFLTTKQRYVRVFLENSDIHIKGNMDSLQDAKITGSLSHATYDSLYTSLAGITDQGDSLVSLLLGDAGSKLNAASRTALEANIETIREQKMERIHSFILKYPKSQVGVYEISEFVLRNYPVAGLEKLFNSLDTAAQQSNAGKRLKKRIVTLAKTSVGQPILDFTQNDMSKKPVQFSQYNKGKYVLLDFWASWCGPCRGENPNVLKAYQHFKDKGLAILGVSLDEDSSAWKKAVRDDQLPWKQVSDLKGWKNAVAVEYGIDGIPINFLVNPNGIIVAKDLRGMELEDKLAEFLK
jgi:peroxiredoxin